MGYIKKLEGKHLYLAVPKVEDATTYVKWLSDFETTDGLGNSAMIMTVEAEEAWIQSMQGKTQFAIIRKEDDTLIGNCGIQEINQIRQCAEVGLFIGEEENRGKGYGQEVLRLLLDFALMRERSTLIRKSASVSLEEEEKAIMQKDVSGMKSIWIF